MTNDLLKVLKSLQGKDVEFESSESNVSVDEDEKSGNWFYLASHKKTCFRIPSIEWLEDKVVEIKNNSDKKSTFHVKNDVYGFWWYSFKGTYDQNSLWVKDKDRLIAVAMLLDKIIEEK